MKARLISFLLFIFILNSSLFSQSTKSDTLIIGLKKSPPFIIVEGEEYKGVSIDLWENIADKMDVSYTFKEYDLHELLDALEKQEVHLSINPLTVTAERLDRFGFTQPFYVTNIGIATKIQTESTILGFIKKLFSLEFMQAALLLLLIIFIFGFILWLAERKHNHEQFGKGIHGLGDGIWWSAVTMTTVGYGDKAPRTGWGRVISVVWMFTAVVVISSFTAGIASSLTINQLESNIKDVSDLKKVRVGTISGSASAEFLKEYDIIFYEYTDIDKGLQDVDKDKIQAFVYDEAILRYLVKDMKLHERIIIIPSAYSKEYFGFASGNYDLINKLNPALISTIESPLWKDILERYGLDYKK